MGAWVDSRSPFVYIRFLSFTGLRRRIHTRRSELWHRSQAKSSIKSCFGQNYECISMMPDCSFEELIPIFSTRYSGDHLWLRPAMKRCGISRLGSQITPGEFTTHDMASSQSSHYNHLLNPSFMYCRTYVNLYDAVRSVIPCDKSHKHQFSFNNDGEQRELFGWDREFQYGGNFSVSWDWKSTSGLLRNFLGLMPR